MMSKSRGTRQEVFEGVALQTAGGLMKCDLELVNGRIVSAKRRALGIKNADEFIRQNRLRREAQLKQDALHSRMQSLENIGDADSECDRIHNEMLAIEAQRKPCK
jgi:hypothetical protein